MKDVEIGTIGETKCYMKLDELFRIANKEVQDFADQVCEDNIKLKHKLDLAIEALEKIADVGSWRKYNDVWYIGDKPLYKVASDALKGMETEK